MTISDAERNDLILYRLQQSSELENEIQSHIKNDFYSTAVNRMYYSVFYCLTALALIYRFETSKHNQLIGWFNKEFINKNIFDKEQSKIVLKLFEKRKKSDYDPFIDFQEDEVKAMFHEMKGFVQGLKQFVYNKIK